jgi:hypothetical protein
MIAWRIIWASERPALSGVFADRPFRIAELADLESQVADVCRQTDRIVRAALKAAGYRQHKRGEWRKKRGGTNPSD